MSIFDRKRPLKTLKRYFDRFFQKKYSEKIDFVDTTIPPVDLIGGDIIPDGTGGYEGYEDILQGAQATAISDADYDTQVQCEESADEDAIRFDTAGKERFRMEGNDTNGGALYIKEGSGTTAPGTPTSGEGVIYEKNDGKLYFKNDAGTEYELTASGGGSYKWILKGDSGSNQDIDGDYIGWVKGGTGISTTVASEIASDPTRSVTIDCDLEGTELKSTGETGGSKFLREDGDGTCSWQTPSGGGSMSSFTLTGDSGSNQTVTDGNTVDIEGGTGISTVVGATDKVTINCDVTQGAPDDAQYVTLATDGDLSAERVLTQGTGIDITDGGANGNVTVNCDLEGTELKSTGETGGNKFLREDGDGTCSWQTGLGGGTVQGTDHTYDIEAANEGATGALARGENSVDLQTERSANTMRAGGANSAIIAGEDNTASGTHSGVYAGKTGVASGTYSTTLGGLSSTASGEYSGVLSGHQNTASGDWGGVVAGRSNTSSGDYSLSAGQSNTASGDWSTALGFNGTNSKDYATTLGNRAITTREGEFTIGLGSNTFKTGICGGGVRTTDATSTELTLSMGERFTIETDSAVTFELQVSCVGTTLQSTVNGGVLVQGTIVNDSGTTDIGGLGAFTQTNNLSATMVAGGSSVAVTADNTTNSLKIVVTGLALVQIDWTASVRFTESG